MSGQSEFTHEDVMRILEIVDRSEDVEILVEYNGMKLHVIKGSASKQGAPAITFEAAAPKQVTSSPSVTLTPSAAEQSPASAPQAAQPQLEDDGHTGVLPAGSLTIRAPHFGRFYRSSSPMEPPFVEIGSRVTAEDSVGVVEVMKLFNEIKAGVSGTIADIRAANEESVEEGQILFIVQPD